MSKEVATIWRADGTIEKGVVPANGVEFSNKEISAAVGGVCMHIVNTLPLAYRNRNNKSSKDAKLNRAASAWFNEKLYGDVMEISLTN